MNIQKIFFSYSRIDGSEFATRLALDLKKNGFDVWLDQEDIRAGSEWDLEIAKALETCDCLLFIETQKSVVSTNVLDEVYYALEQHKKVIPLILIDSKTPFRLQRLQHIDFTKDYPSGLSLLLNELERISSAESIKPEESPAAAKSSKTSKKYSGLILVIAFTVVVAGSIIYKAKDEDVISSEGVRVVNSNDTTTNSQATGDIEPTPRLKEDAIKVEELPKKKVKTNSTNKSLANNGDVTVSTKGKEEANLDETFTGDWELVEVNPKARLKRGYMKIESINETKVTIKSHLQFYYFQAGGTAFVDVFNAFVGCTSCTLKRNMKLTNEDVAIGSRVINVLKEDQAGGGEGWRHSIRREFK